MKRILILGLTFGAVIGKAQTIRTSAEYKSQIGGQTLNALTTAVPFLMIGPDSKQGSLGDAGAATDPDINSIHWNGSKLAFTEKTFGAGFTVTPWLRNLVPDINMYYLSGYGRINSKQVVGASLRYFSLGTIEFTDINALITVATVQTNLQWIWPFRKNCRKISRWVLLPDLLIQR
jgi:hypothetical protein